MWFGYDNTKEVRCICHMGTYATMNTGNLLVHQWIMTTNPYVVVEYIQYDDNMPSDPLQLYCTVEDLAKTEAMYGKLIAIVKYWLRSKHENKGRLLLLGLDTSDVVTSIVGIPAIKQCHSFI